MKSFSAPESTPTHEAKLLAMPIQLDVELENKRFCKVGIVRKERG
jgi:hypothetical protein